MVLKVGVLIRQAFRVAFKAACIHYRDGQDPTNLDVKKISSKKVCEFYNTKFGVSIKEHRVRYYVLKGWAGQSPKKRGKATQFPAAAFGAVATQNQLLQARLPRPPHHHQPSLSLSFSLPFSLPLAPNCTHRAGKARGPLLSSPILPLTHYSQSPPFLPRSPLFILFALSLSATRFTRPHLFLIAFIAFNCC